MKQTFLMGALGLAVALLPGCRATDAKFRPETLPEHIPASAIEATPDPQRVPSEYDGRASRPAPDSVLEEEPIRPALSAAPPSLEEPPPVPIPPAPKPDSVRVGRVNTPGSGPTTFYSPPPKPVTNRTLLLAGVVGALGLVALSVSIVSLPIILTVGTTLTLLFLAGGAVLLAGRKLGKLFRKRKAD